MRSRPCPHRDIAKNALLRWRVFVYWTFLGVFDALVFFFGAYFMFENTTVTSNGQVSTQPVLLVGWASWGSHTGVGRLACGAGPGASGHQTALRPRRLCSCRMHPSRGPRLAGLLPPRAALGQVRAVPSLRPSPFPVGINFVLSTLRHFLTCIYLSICSLCSE